MEEEQQVGGGRDKLTISDQIIVVLSRRITPGSRSLFLSTFKSVTAGGRWRLITKLLTHNFYNLSLSFNPSNSARFIHHPQVITLLP